jgi:uncharacterized small protein (DUF1192 family)
MIDPFLDERPARSKTVHEIGQDLAALSVDELDARVVLLKAEIERLNAEKQRKEAVKSAAADFFKLR